MSEPCPCGSASAHGQCCGPFLDGRETAPTAEALMRSRYTAYVRQDVPYLLATWHPSTRPEKLGLEEGLGWHGLTVLAAANGGPTDTDGIVEFVAAFSYQGNQQKLRERSRFVREDGAWFYVDGVELPQTSHKTGRNDPCPCGSGKKHKKCCLTGSIP
ncbi:MAG: YchJ family metal-binding protein [Thermodesulfobacteriota bacterium]